MTAHLTDDQSFDPNHCTDRNGLAMLATLTLQAKDGLANCSKLLDLILREASRVNIDVPSLERAAISDDENELLSLEQVAKRLSVSTVTLMKMRRSGNFPEPIHISQRRRAYREGDIKEWLRSGAKQIAPGK